MASMSDDRPTARPAGWDCPHSRPARLLPDARDRTRTIVADVKATEPLKPSVLRSDRLPAPYQLRDWKPRYPDPKLCPRLSWSFESKEHAQSQHDSATIYSTLSPSSWIGGLNKAPIMDADSWFLASSTCEYTFSVTEASAWPSSPATVRISIPAATNWVAVK